MGKIILLYIIFTISICCNNKNENKILSQKLKQLYSKEIIFSKYYSTAYDSTNIKCNISFSQKAKILVYIDSLGCIRL